MQDADKIPARKVDIRMKKIVALMLLLLTMMMAGAAMAELQEAPFEGVWVQFEEGFEVLLPAAVANHPAYRWAELDLTDPDQAMDSLQYCPAGGHRIVW